MPIGQALFGCGAGPALRRVIGLGPHHDASLAKAALCMAIAIRGGDVAEVIMHTDQGGEYTGKVFTKACADCGVKQSMGATATALDNAVAEAFNSTLEWELLADHAPFASHEQARSAITEWIEDYNHQRLHSTIGMLPPAVYEQRIREAA